MTRILTFLAITLIAATVASAEDTTALRPPKGSQYAIIVFEDLQCPECGRANPVLEQASRTYKIPLVRYDFPLPMHNWSYNAALIARYFDTQSERLGDEFRDYVFSHQLEIFPYNLRSIAEKFAADHKVVLPFAIDPQGELAAKITADKNLGERVGINHTPTIYLVSNKPQSTPIVEVKDKSQLFQMIDALKKE
ncbi:MAG TPA: thioredoxin domain-containing protein [Terriglobales bacterium]|nr:thioredoxin domain-containing protein [Terriglobales bacterium]